MFKTKIENPILRGFNPDPCIVRAEDVYYIVVSSFEWLPGIRVYSSEDLVNWNHETDILTNQVNLQGNPIDCSIWAPQLSYHEGVFYLIYTDVKGTKRPFKDTHNYLITATDINGPWTEPVYLNSSGFDPSLFHDTDGRKWFLNEIWDYRMSTPNKSAGIVLQEFDDKSKQLIGPVYKIFDGTELAKTEAPHIYKHREYYYLITAEGGTGKGHSVTVCRSKKITGPYELDPQYPMLTASDKPMSPIQCSGHGSLVKNNNGTWYMSYLCSRPLEKDYAILGRETAIQEVYWTDDGWLRLSDGGNGPQLETTIETKQRIKQEINNDFYDEFNGKLSKEWNSVRIMPNDDWCDLKSRPNYLRMIAGESIQSLFDTHLLGIRQKDFKFNACTQVDFSPKTFNQLAGLTLFLNESNYYYCYITYDEELGKVLRFISANQGESNLYNLKISLEENSSTYLKVSVNQLRACFYYKEKEEQEWKLFIENIDIRNLSGGFTGNFVGICTQDMDGKSSSYADFNYFSYKKMN